MLAIGRALMLNPKLLLLDEPFEGLAPNLVAELEHAIGLMMGEGIAMLIVEQHVEAALRLSENAVLLERGRVTHAGPSSGLMQDRVGNDYVFRTDLRLRPDPGGLVLRRL
jgi:branched-chain amino acid transport system ATP-binding protein